MGLAGPKNRTKISADPNNTHWSKSTDRFGHKILLKQGWSPGSFLGAKDAKHAAHYTAANASHIRVAVKDDTLGLGAKRGKAENDTFGLSALQGLLGRLNGKSDGELKKEESAHRDLKLQVYTNQRWGGIRFVSGGLLVGDKIENLVTQDIAAKQPVAEAGQPETRPAEKKRKRPEHDESESVLKEKKRKESDSSCQDDNETRAKKKSKSRKSKKPEAEVPSTNTADLTSASAGGKESGEKPDKMTRKEAKKARKLERLARKGAKESKKRKQKKEKKAESSSDSSSSEDDTTTSVTTSAPASGTSTPTAGFAGGRLAVRQRYIAQKKRASMDPQALKEIFMIKAEA
ncbi:g-patch domain-containing protein [Diplodia corticola]|uniref:PinX1-related protein 1 n=1 Tax=Diplodia corticola TaxID=236234 RepID=A0A1J9RVG7_9PEZI|nr:g-patch domain-containing protein [Diplodia corticola]OJD32383.1 g-patch domain-containing protein [Diplodia corticola]